MSPKILHHCFSKLYIFLQLYWAALDNEEWVTGIVVTGKVVKLDLIAFIGLRCFSHWRCVLWKIGLFGLSGYCMDCIRYGLHSVASCIFYWIALDWVAIVWIAMDVGGILFEVVCFGWFALDSGLQTTPKRSPKRSPKQSRMSSVSAAIPGRSRYKKTQFVCASHSSADPYSEKGRIAIIYTAEPEGSANFSLCVEDCDSCYVFTFES